MKKTFQILICFLLISSLFGCQQQDKDNIRFKKEYESYNEQKLDGKTLSAISIDENNTIKYVDYQHLIDGLENGSHVVYMGYPTCPWCRRAIPVLIDTVNQYAGVSIYYCDMKKARDDYENHLSTEDSQAYQKVLDVIACSEYDFGEIFDYFDDGSIKIGASTVFFIKEGEIVGAAKRTVESHIDPYEELTQLQTNQLSDIYKTYLDIVVKKVPVGCYGC